MIICFGCIVICVILVCGVVMGVIVGVVECVDVVGVVVSGIVCFLLLLFEGGGVFLFDCLGWNVSMCSSVIVKLVYLFGVSVSLFWFRLVNW